MFRKKKNNDKDRMHYRNSSVTVRYQLWLFIGISDGRLVDLAEVFLKTTFNVLFVFTFNVYTLF